MRGRLAPARPRVAWRSIDGRLSRRPVAFDWAGPSTTRVWGGMGSRIVDPQENADSSGTTWRGDVKLLAGADREQEPVDHEGAAPGAARSSEARLTGGSSDGPRLDFGAVVGVEDAGLSRSSFLLVGDVEEEQHADRLIAGGDRDRVGVRASLRRLVDRFRGRLLGAGVEPDPLPVGSPSAARTPRTRSAVSCPAAACRRTRCRAGRPGLLVVGKPDRRALRVGEVGGDARVLGVGVEREAVHHRPVPPERDTRCRDPR